MQVNVLTATGKSTEKLTLEKSVFDITPRESLLKQYLRVFQHNQRQGTSDVKDRGEVSGGGRKPWRQKGTGRARVGSSRVPLWRGGGIAHGPQPRSWTLTLPKKMKRLAIISALSTKAHAEQVFVLDEFKLDQPKTIAVLELFEKLQLKSGNTLVVLGENDLIIRKSVANIPWVKTALVINLNGFEILTAQKIVFTKKSLELVQAKYKGEEK